MSRRRKRGESGPVRQPLPDSDEDGESLEKPESYVRSMHKDHSFGEQKTLSTEDVRAKENSREKAGLQKMCIEKKEFVTSSRITPGLAIFKTSTFLSNFSNKEWCLEDLGLALSERVHQLASSMGDSNRFVTSVPSRDRIRKSIPSSVDCDGHGHSSSPDELIFTHVGHWNTEMRELDDISRTLLLLSCAGDSMHKRWVSDCFRKVCDMEAMLYVQRLLNTNNIELVTNALRSEFCLPNLLVTPAGKEREYSQQSSNKQRPAAPVLASALCRGCCCHFLSDPSQQDDKLQQATPLYPAKCLHSCQCSTRLGIPFELTTHFLASRQYGLVLYDGWCFIPAYLVSSVVHRLAKLALIDSAIKLSFLYKTLEQGRCVIVLLLKVTFLIHHYC